MGFSKLVSRTITTPYQDNGRGGTTIDRIVLHHMASTGFEGVLSMWINATRQGSANYAVSNEGELVGAVDELNRSWSLANYGYDARAITFEIENEALGGSWPVSDAAHKMVAKAVADICTRWKIPCDRAHIVTHREVAAMGYSYSTACPGGLDADRIVREANDIINKVIIPIAIGEDDMPTIVQVAVPGNPLYAVSVGAIAHQTGSEAGTALSVLDQPGGAKQLTTAKFNELLHTLQIPVEEVYHFGGHPIGYSWSRAGDIAAALSKFTAEKG